MYKCLICNNEQTDQKSHHTKHINTKKHKTEKRVRELELNNMTPEERNEKYGKDDVNVILASMETFVIEKTEETIKLTKTNTIIYEKTTDEINATFQNESFKQKFLAFLNRQHNLLRGASVTGDEALDDILYCLLFCYLQDKISDTGDFDLANSEKACYKGTIQRKVKDFVKYLDIGYLLEHTEELRVKEGTDSIVKCGKLLSKHPKTKGLMKDENFINCNDVSTLTKLFEECRQFANDENIFDNIDIIGIAYEYISTKHSGNGGTSKEMGQYFTERPLMFMCFQLIDESDLIDLGIDDDSTLGDEFCATFGFPLSAKTFLKNKFNINIQDKNMYGVEFHERLSRFALMNAMFAMKNTKHITRGNSFITNVKSHLDFSVHNVPFGKSMTPKNIEKTYKDFLKENPDKGYPEFEDYIPFNTKKIDAILSSQVVLQKTKKMGLMIIKDGEETSGKSNDKYRKWFCENCVIKKIMKIPTGAFTCTGTKTVCIYFIKKEGQMTENIQFLQLSDDGNSITEICNVPMETMKKNHYSWDPNNYVVDEEMEKMMATSTCELKQLGDLCEYIKTGVDLTKEEQKNNVGDIKYIGSGKRNISCLNKYNVNDKFIITGRVGTLGEFELLNGKYWINGNAHYFKIKDEYNMSYVYYCLKYNNSLLTNYIKGSDRERLNITDLKQISIPIPPIETQTDLVKVLDDLADQKRLLLDRKSGIERQMRYYFETQIKKNDVSVKELKNVVTIVQGESLTKKQMIKGDYNVIGGGKIIGTHNQANRNGCETIITRVGELLVSYFKTPFFLTDNGLSLKSNENTINEYIYYMFKYSHLYNSLRNLYKGGGQQVVSKTNVGNMKVPIITDKDVLKQVVEYLDKLEGKKNSICEEINEIDVLMKDVITQSYS
tara:strand:+ start:3057 stop:5732 length:2676 start_codon:yes stop_codon:yes gene_type:complete